VQVEMIYLNEGFNGNDGLYADDISIIVLANKVSFSNGVTPVCIDWKSIYNVNNGDRTKVNMLYFIVCNFIKYIKYNLKLIVWFDSKKWWVVIVKLFTQVVLRINSKNQLLICYKISSNI